MIGFVSQCIDSRSGSFPGCGFGSDGRRCFRYCGVFGRYGVAFNRCRSRRFRGGRFGGGLDNRFVCFFFGRYRCLFFKRFFCRSRLRYFRRHGVGFGFFRLRLAVFFSNFFGGCRFNFVQIRNLKHAACTQFAVSGNIRVRFKQRIDNLFDCQVFRTDGGSYPFDCFTFTDGMGFAVAYRFCVLYVGFAGCICRIFFIGFVDGYSVLIFFKFCFRNGFAVCCIDVCKSGFGLGRIACRVEKGGIFANLRACSDTEY